MTAKAELRWDNGTLTTMSGRVLADNIGLDQACLENLDVVITVRSTVVRPRSTDAHS